MTATALLTAASLATAATISRFFSSTYAAEPIVAAALGGEDKAMLIRLDPDGTVQAFGDPDVGAPLLDTVPAEWSTPELIEEALVVGTLSEASAEEHLDVINFSKTHGTNYDHTIAGATLPPATTTTQDSLFFGNLAGDGQGMYRADPDGTVTFINSAGEVAETPETLNTITKLRDAVITGTVDLKPPRDAEGNFFMAQMGLLPMTLFRGATINGQLIPA